MPTPENPIPTPVRGGMAGDLQARFIICDTFQVQSETTVIVLHSPINVSILYSLQLFRLRGICWPALSPMEANHT